MNKYDVIVIGFGKAGKTLAGKWASEGKKVTLIEKDENMFGGTCINVGCIPTKTLLRAAQQGKEFSETFSEKDIVTTRLRGKNFEKLNSVVDIKVGSARFLEDKIIEVKNGDEVEELTAEIIVINTGSVSNKLPIEGLLTTKNVYDSTGILNLNEKPGSLGIIGAGVIGLEFAGIFARLGTKVKVFDPNDTILKRSEPEAASLAKEYLENQGIEFVLNSRVSKLDNVESKVHLTSNDTIYEFDAVMYATGRKSNIEGLNLENTNIELTERGAIQVDEYCQTSVENVFAVGDVNGGPQFTYVSLDDFRIVYGYVNGNKEYSLKNRRHIPNTIFIYPPLSQVGLTEAQVKEQGFDYKVNTQIVATMPKAHVNGDLRGVWKVIVDKNTEQILGATFFGANSYEYINLVTMAMDNKISYKYFTKQIFTHPSMAENLNDIFNF